jgi:penicillin-binding protein 1A
LLLSILGLAAWIWIERNILADLPKDLSEYRSYRPPTACRIVDARGIDVDRFYLERRFWVPVDELPPYLLDAFVAAEDRGFFRHTGVEPVGILRAVIVNWRAGRTVQGGSTITQQLVKNLIIGKERSYTRKLREAVLARRLERTLSKRQILELYLNFIALGSGNYGVEAAARDYFGVSARDLDMGQSALLAGLVPAPSRYSPRSDIELAGRRRELVLRSMVEEGYAEPEEAAKFLEAPVALPRRAAQSAEAAAAYVTEVRREVRRIFGSEVPFREGLTVHTPLDLALQKEAEAAVYEALVQLQERQGRRGPLRRLPPEDWPGFLARAPRLLREGSSGAPIAPEDGRCFEALVPESGDLGDLRAASFRFAMKPEERQVLVRGPDPKSGPKPLSSLVGAGDVLDVCVLPDGSVGLDPNPWAEGAAVVLENASGRVLAVVGGKELAIEGFVRATQARRQPGSSFKPFVYAAALLGGRSQLDMVLDGPIVLPAGGGKLWAPKNYTPGFAGMLPMRHALARSINTVAVRLLLERGSAEVVRVARAMGVRSPLRTDPTIALGSSEVTPMDQALGYCTIARLGVPTDPVWIDRVDDVRGREVGSAGGDIVVAGQTVGRLPGGPLRRALPSGVAYELADMMREVVRNGTARKASKPGYDRAGKTGTTNGFVDAWFVGFTPRHTIAVWVGTDGTASLGDKETGGRTALPAWIRIAENLPEAKDERIPVPPEVVLVPADGTWVGVRRGRIPEKLMTVAPPLPGPLPDFPGG